MKKTLPLVFLFFVSFLCNSCFWSGPDDPPTPTNFHYYNPVIIERSELESSVQLMEPQGIFKSGKIYIKDDLMFMNDVNKGFHVYNYSNPENPVLIGFIQTLGATDLAIRDNLIYVNQAVDLVTLEYNAVDNTLIEKHRNRNVFPPKLSPNGQYASTAENQIIVDWQLP